MGLDNRKHVFDVCEQQRRRAACPSAQSDQSAFVNRYSLSGSAFASIIIHSYLKWSHLRLKDSLILFF